MRTALAPMPLRDYARMPLAVAVLQPGFKAKLLLASARHPCTANSPEGGGGLVAIYRLAEWGTPCSLTCCAPSPPLKTTRLCRMRSCSVCLPLVASARPFRFASAALPSCSLQVQHATNFAVPSTTLPCTLPSHGLVRY